MKIKALAPEDYKAGTAVHKGKSVAAAQPDRKGGAAALKKAQAPQAKKASKLSKVI